MKRKMLSILLCAAMMGTTLAGATSVLAADDKDSDSKWEYKEATLTFLIDPDTASSRVQTAYRHGLHSPEWGYMLNEGRACMQSAPWLMIFPGLAIFIVVVVFNMLGDSIRDILDPRNE